MHSRILYTALVALVMMERLLEVALSRRNVRLVSARGGVEFGGGDYRWMVLAHTAFLLACPAEVWLAGRRFHPALGWPMLAALVAAMGLRYWAVATLGERWNTRVICLPGVPAITGGPYRWMRHPNYLAVGIEVIALPLIHTAWLTAVIFSTLNVPLLIRRIQVEEAALSELSDYNALLGRQRRFVPWRR